MKVHHRTTIAPLHVTTEGQSAMHGRKSVVLVAAAVLALTACSSSKNSTPADSSSDSGVSTPSGSGAAAPAKHYNFGASVIGTAFPAVVSFDNGLKAAAATQNVTLTIADGGAKADKQVNDLHDFTSRGVDAIIVNPLDSVSIEAPVKAALAAGIPVAEFGQIGKGTDCAYPGTVGSVGYDENGWAKKEGEETMKLLPNGGNVAILSGLAGLASTKIRDDVYKQTIAAQSNIKVVADQPGDFAADKARAAMENILQAHPDLDLVYAADDTMAVAAVQAIKAAHRLDKIKVIGIGGSKAAMASIKAGEMTATVWSSLEVAGQDIIKMLVDHINGTNTAMGQCIQLPQVLVDSSNIAEYADKGQF
ncbi:sugar ABC transporter substrate-binding protein [Jatrophihabitans cynanchi]|uniref:Sugar ABC transporter substrate-binding protein n=1 Tax=Jatrophihabitans cynanchi TaxID=2944128 RepID=A0ABY7K6T6_9ACTN|nr:sugar ABC transporter substrate-binding protein [Jatrophihabitans sp. SB3-54]WAX59024.1 sugar ABC transporter substrate-binding protein [Jatrophihabitans sp. SB3-54]